MRKYEIQEHGTINETINADYRSDEGNNRTEQG